MSVPHGFCGNNVCIWPIHSCDGTRSVRQLVKFRDSGLVYTHSNCVCNLVTALRARHQLQFNKPANMVPLAAVIAKLPVPPGMPRVTYNMVIARYGGGKRKQYAEAACTLAWDPIDYHDGQLTAFIKADKYVEADSIPRCIQFRSKRYNLALGRYLVPLEQWVYDNIRQSEYGRLGLEGVKVFAKCMNSYQRAESLRLHWDSVPNAVAWCVDYSKFDSRLSCDHLKLEQDYYYRVFGRHPLLRQLLRFQLRNKGRAGPVRYSTRGTRASGDMNTSLGNCLINLAMLASAIPGRYLIDGDDAVIIVQRGTPFPHNLFEQNGFKMKADLATCFEHIDFCQCRPVKVGDVWRMARNPKRVIDRLGWTTHIDHKPNDLVYSLAWCERAMGDGLPIEQAFSAHLFALAPKGKLVPLDEVHHARMEPRPSNRPVLASTRYSYELAWGYTLQQQYELEGCPWGWVTSHQDQYIRLIEHLGQRVDRTHQYLEYGYVRRAVSRFT